MRRKLLICALLFAPGALHAADDSPLRLSEAAQKLGDCETAQREAQARAARGELSLTALLTFERATGRARAEWARLRTVAPNISVTRWPVASEMAPPRTVETAPRPAKTTRLAATARLPFGQPLAEILVVPPSLSTPPRLAQSFIVAALPSPPREVSRRPPAPQAAQPEIALTASTSINTPPAQPNIIPPIIGTRPAPGRIIKPQASLPDSLPTGLKPAPVASFPAVPDAARLAQLESQLGKAEARLNQADSALSDGQKQLAQFTATLRAAMQEAGPEATGLHPFVRVAEKYAGTPYVWGGASRGGFDCSGLIILVMRELGYKTPPHSAAEQFKYGQPIAQQILKPGDLVFFANTYKPGVSHVGIYLGKRRFIHAAGTGKGTIVSSLDAAKFQSKYVGAKRLVPAR